MLSIVVIAKNEERMIKDCLLSAQFADELIVVDSGSTDKTLEISKSLGAKVISIKGQDYSEFRNMGLKSARGEWIFYLDADERISPLLRQEILQIASSKPTNFFTYAVPRKNMYLGKSMSHGGWGNDYVIRFFFREYLHHWKNPLHEEPVYEGKLDFLKHELIHFSHRDLSSMLDKTLGFTAYEADLRFNAGHPPVVWWRLFRVMLTEFWHRFIRLSAWRDGPEGIIDGLFQVYNMFVIYARLWEMQISKTRV
jgi:(heptosyl)LPS beta-1,4-glucosyltransferase